MAKKSEQITTHLTEAQKQQAAAIAELKGFDTLSAYVLHLIKADAAEQKEALEKLAPVFGWEKNSEGSVSSGQFMRVLSDAAKQENRVH